jgi:hypothetical protein
MFILHIIPILLTLGAQPECDGFGICILEQVTEVTTTECLKYENCIRADLDYIADEFILTVSESKIKDKAYIKYFTKENFELEKDFTISDELAIALDCPKGSVLPKGKYPINEEHGKIIVRFNI